MTHPQGKGLKLSGLSTWIFNLWAPMWIKMNSFFFTWKTVIFNKSYFSIRFRSKPSIPIKSEKGSLPFHRRSFRPSRKTIRQNVARRKWRKRRCVRASRKKQSLFRESSPETFDQTGWGGKREAREAASSGQYFWRVLSLTNLAFH